MVDENNNKFEFEHSKSLTKKEKQNYIKIYNGLCILIKQECEKSGNNKEQRIKALEDCLYSVIKRFPELLYIKKMPLNEERVDGMIRRYYFYWENFLYKIQSYGLYRLLDKLCEDVEICKINVLGNENLFFHSIPSEPYLVNQYSTDKYNKECKFLISLLEKHPELLSLQDEYGNTFAGKLLKSYEPDSEYLKPFEKYIIASLNNSKIATQQNAVGFNLGMICAKKKHKKFFDIAYQNAFARAQKNEDGETMEIIANNNGLVIPPLTDEQVYDFYSQTLQDKIDEICK